MIVESQVENVALAAAPSFMSDVFDRGHQMRTPESTSARGSKKLSDHLCVQINRWWHVKPWFSSYLQPMPVGSGIGYPFSFLRGAWSVSVPSTDPIFSSALLRSTMAMALAAHSLLCPTACAPWRGASPRVRGGSELVSAVSSSCSSRFERGPRALAFGRGKW